LTLLSLYLSGHLGLSQREINYVFWMPPAAWGVGYFFWGWFADRFAQENRRPVGLFVFLTVCSIALGFTTWSTSVAFTMALMSWACFIAGGFQMVALKVGSYSFPREQAAMMTGIASGSFALVNYVLLQFPGVGLGALFSQKQYAQAFWIVALCPVVGVVVWLFLSRNQSTQNT
jgi:sugar phosphate permease